MGAEAVWCLGVPRGVELLDVVGGSRKWLILVLGSEGPCRASGLPHIWEDSPWS